MREGLRASTVTAGGQLLMVAGLIAIAVIPVAAPTWAVALVMIPVGVGGSFTVPP